jgi:hypothetical protein
MWLINCESYQLDEFVTEDSAPKYAILSHTWNHDEVTFDEMTHGRGQDRLGYAKIRFCCEQAKLQGLTHAWVDT